MSRGDPRVNEVRDGKIICVKCEEWKDPGEFSRQTRMKRGRQSWCRSCTAAYAHQHWHNMSEYEKNAIKTRRREVYYARNPEKARAASREWYAKYYLKSMRDLTQREYEAALLAQDGKCAIPACNRPAKHLDHDHSCCPTRSRSCRKCARGLLCHQCNIMLGMANDNTELLRSAVDWLESNPSLIEMISDSEGRIKDTLTV